MREQLNNYIQNPTNDRCNFELALEYEKLGQGAAAISFYLRTAERTDSIVLAYESLIKAANWFDKHKNRANTVKGLLQHAISICPNRPEAYFLLSRLHEVNNEHTDSYTFAAIGLGVCDFNSTPLETDVDYPGRYGLIFEQAVSSWWWGRPEESRNLFVLLADHHWDEMQPVHKESVQQNLARMGN